MKINSENIQSNNRITTVLLLAAGTGSRLLPLTKESPKCLTLVNEVSILERLVENLASKGIKKLVIVTGHLSDSIRDFLGDNYKDIAIQYIHSPLYKTTNNIYSLWMAREIMKEPFILIESDLVFDPSLLGEMMYPDRMAVAGIKDWMNGTTVTIDKYEKILGFKNDTQCSEGSKKYKTVNIYSFSLVSWSVIAARLDKHIREEKVNGYYETVFAELVAENLLSLKAVSFDEKPWYEIDTLMDLKEAIKLFPIKRLLTEIKNIKPNYAIE